MAHPAVRAAAAGSPRADHVCEVYEDVTALREQALAFLTEGSAAGNRLEYAGTGGVEALRAELERTPGYDALLARGELAVRSATDMYGPGETIDPAGPLAAYVAATEDALARGYTGLRVAVEASALVRTPAQREAFTRYEHLIDRYMVDHPFFALCAYDARALGPEAAAELACLHPRASSGATAFRWYAEREAGAGLAGEVDIACRELFEATLARTMPLLRRPRLVVDARPLEFIDHRGLLALDRYAQATGTAVTLHTDAPMVHRLANLLSLRAVEAQRPG